MTNFLLVIGLSIVNLALIRSRQRFPDVEREFEVPFVPWVPILAVLGNAVLLANIVYQNPAIAGIGVLADEFGVALWVPIRERGPSVEEFEAETPTAVATHSPTEHDYQLVVPVANEDNVDQLMRTATDLVKNRDAEILVMHAVNIPQQTPYAAAQDRVDEGRPIVDRAMNVAEEAGIPVKWTVRIAHDPADAIRNTVEQYDSDAVLMGWGGHRSSHRDVVLGSTVDEITAEADADVFVENVGAEAEVDVDSILLPWTDNVHADLAAETARAVATTTDAQVDVVRVVDPEADDEDHEAAEELLDEAVAHFEDADVPVEAHLVEDDDVVETLAEEADDSDVTVMAAESEGILRKLVFGAVPEALGNRLRSTTIMVRRNVAPSSRLKELLG